MPLNPSNPRAAINALACLRAFPRLRRRTAAPQYQEDGTQRRSVNGASAAARGMGMGLGYGFGARRWVGSAAALAVREEEEDGEAVEDLRAANLGGVRNEMVVGDARDAGRITSQGWATSEQHTAQQLIDHSLSALDSRLAAKSKTAAGPRRRRNMSEVRATASDAGQSGSARKTKSDSIRAAKTPDSHLEPPPSSDPPASAESEEIIWDTEHILDQALSSTLSKPSRRKSRTQSTTRSDLPWPTRHLRLRTVRAVDLEFAETGFNNARRRLAQIGSRDDAAAGDVDPVHRDVLMAHINHLLYLSARIPDPRGYARIKAYLESYDLSPDSHTYLTRLILLDKMNQMNQVAAVCRGFNNRRVRGDGSPEERDVRRGKTIDGADATVLLNMTIWMLAKRGQWNIVGPAYNKLLTHSPHATKHLSSAFPPDYFTPSHDLSFALYFRNETSLDKITYQSLIRALAFHGNVVPALAVMQDLLNDSRGYTVALSDFVALFQGFARFGRIPVGWEDLEGVVGARALQGWDAEDSLRPVPLEEEASFGKPKPDSPMFPPPIFPEPSSPASSTGSSRSHKMDALKQMTEIWAGKVNTWDQHAESDHLAQSAPTRLEREWTLVTLQQVFQSFLAIPPIFDTPQSTSAASERTTKKWWEPNLAEAPSPRSIYYIMLAFSRTTDTNLPVMRAVWEHLESKFGEGNEEGWTGWRLDARLRRLRDWLVVGK